MSAREQRALLGLPCLSPLSTCYLHNLREHTGEPRERALRAANWRTGEDKQREPRARQTSAAILVATRRVRTRIQYKHLRTRCSALRGFLAAGPPLSLRCARHRSMLKWKTTVPSDGVRKLGFSGSFSFGCARASTHHSRDYTGRRRMGATSAAVCVELECYIMQIVDYNDLTMSKRDAKS